MFYLVQGSITLNLLFGFSLFLLVRRRIRAASAAPAATPSSVAPLVAGSASEGFHISGEQFSLSGPEWQWIGDTPASYGCISCGQWQNVEMRQYKHLPSSSVFALLRHSCGTGQVEATTDAIEMGGGME